MLRSILLSALLTIGVFGAVTYSSCVLDKCSSVTCQNGGSCKDGNCICPSGYTGSNCETRTCEANQTAQVRFVNKTGTSQTYSVLWDGSVITTVAPGATSSYYTVAAGQHTLLFKIANSNTEACTQSTPVLLACSSMEYWCTK
jgi:hypothetical protein